jgi:hypothetical protein
MKCGAILAPASTKVTTNEHEWTLIFLIPVAGIGDAGLTAYEAFEQIETAITGITDPGCKA